MKNSLQLSLEQDWQDKSLFEQAKQYAYDYADSVAEREVYPSEQAIAQLANFNVPLQQQAMPGQQVLEQLHQWGSPGTVAQVGGRYFGLVNGGVIPTALAAKWLSDFWDQNTPLYITSPVVSVLEQVVEGWLVELLKLPKHTVAGFVSGTSMATLCGLAAGRYRLLNKLGWDVNRKGLNGAPAIKIVASRAAHGTVVKALALLGFGSEAVHWVEADLQGNINPELLPEIDSQTLLILQAGNVNSGSFDNFSALCQQASQAGAWIHIDGAFGLWAAASRALEHHTRGIEFAHSWSVDGHKTLNTPYDSGVILCADREALAAALQASGDYILYGEQRDGMLYTPEMSRRARAVELWATLKSLGKEGVEQLIDTLHASAKTLAEQLQSAGFKIKNRIDFNQILVGFNSDSETQAMLDAIQCSGECWVGGGSWQGSKVIRISVCSWATDNQDIQRTVAAFCTARSTIAGKSA